MPFASDVDVRRMRDQLFFEGDDLSSRLSRFWLLLVLAAVVSVDTHPDGVVVRAIGPLPEPETTTLQDSIDAAGPGRDAHHAGARPQPHHHLRRCRRMTRSGPKAMVVLALVVVALLAPACSSDDSAAPSSDPGTTAAVAPASVEGRADTSAEGSLPTAPIYASRDGVLHIEVTATQVSSTINRQPYTNIYTYDTEIVDGQGEFTPGTASAYIGPEWHLQPGDRLVVDYVNALPDTMFQPIGSDAPEPVDQPINLHTHGLTVAPNGNRDNVLLAVPQGRSNRYEIDIPADHQHGLYWYHSHIHGLADDDVYEGMAGHIVIGRADGDYRELDGLPVVPMMVRYNVVPPNEAGELVDASPWTTKGTATEPRGQMIYTVNGTKAPAVAIGAADPAAGVEADSQVWALTNVTGSASYILALDEVDAADATDPSVVGTPVDLRVVSVDGTPMPSPIVRTGADAARGYLLGPGGRVAILVDGASDPSKVVRLLQVENRSGTGEASAYDWPNQKPIGGYRDYTRQVLAHTTEEGSATGTHVPTPATLTPNYPVAAADLAAGPVEHRRDFFYNDVMAPTVETPNNFPVDFALFPDNPTVQPRVGTIEEWTIYNYSSLHHPFHMHTQFGQVMSIVAPSSPDLVDAPDTYPTVQDVTDLNQPEPAPYYQDIVNVPPAKVGPDGMPILGADGYPIEPGKVVLRLRIDDHLGTYVEHCHRLPHEDRGMMSMIRSIPHEPIVASVAPGGGAVSVVRASDAATIATIALPTPSGPVSSAVGDVDGDAVPDVAVAAGDDTGVTVYSGASGYTDPIRVVDVLGDARFGASVALGDLNADGLDDVIVGQGAGGPPRVEVYDGEATNLLFGGDVYDPTFLGGVSVAAGVVEFGGRVSLITGAGPGGPPTVKVYNVDLFGDADAVMPDSRASITPVEVASFDGADPASRSGVSVATGYPFASGGGYATVIVAPLGGSSLVRLFTVGPHDHDQVDVAASGVARPHGYSPDAARSVTEAATVDVGSDPSLRDGLRAAAVSTVTGAHLVTAPAAGGPVVLWELGVAGAAPTPLSTLAAAASISAV